MITMLSQNFLHNHNTLVNQPPFCLWKSSSQGDFFSNLIKTLKSGLFSFLYLRQSFEEVIQNSEFTNVVRIVNGCVLYHFAFLTFLLISQLLLKKDRFGSVVNLKFVKRKSEDFLNFLVFFRSTLWLTRAGCSAWSTYSVSRKICLRNVLSRRSLLSSAKLANWENNVIVKSLEIRKRPKI